MKLNHWPFILLKRGKDDYFAPPAIPDTPEFEFAEKVFGEAAVLQAYTDNPVWANDIASQLYQLNQLTGMTWEAMQAHAIARPDNWITDLSAALAAALNPNPNAGTSGVGGTIDAVEDFGSSALNTTGAIVAGGGVLQAAQDIANNLTGSTNDVGSAVVNGATNAALQGAAAAGGAGSAVVNGATNAALQGAAAAGGAGSAVVDGATNAVLQGAAAAGGLQLSGNDVAGSEVMGPLGPRDYANSRADEFAADYTLNANQERALAELFFKYPAITNAQIETFIAAHPTTWPRDLFVFEVGIEFNLNPAQADQLILIMRANSNWGIGDLRAYLRTIDPSDMDLVLSQATTAVNLAEENNLTVTETQQLTSAMVGNALYNAENMQAFIDNNPNSWRRVFAVNDYLNSVPGITEAQRNSLLNLANQSAEWNKDFVENLLTSNSEGWKAVVAKEEFFLHNEMSEAQQTMIDNFMAKDSTMTLAVMQTYIDGHAATWERDLGRWDVARDVADDNQFTLEQRNQVAAYMVKFHTIPRATIDSAINTDKVGFLRSLIVFDVGDHYHFSAEQRTTLDVFLRANPQLTAVEVKAYIAAHPDNWGDDLNQAGNTAILSDRHDLTTTQQQLLGTYLLADYRVDVNALDTMIEEDSEAFDDLMASVAEANSISNAHSHNEEQREQVIRLMTSGPKFTEEQMEAFFTQHGNKWSVALQQFDASWRVASYLNLSEADRAIVEKLMLTDPRNTFSGIVNFIQTPANANTWRNDFKFSEMIVRHQISENDANQLKAFLARNTADWTIETVDQYIIANSATWRTSLKLNTASVSIVGLSETHALTDEDKNLLTTWMASNQRITVAEIEALIAANPTTWKQVLTRVKEAAEFADSHHLSQEVKDALIRLNAADSNFKLSDIASLIEQYPDRWIGILQRLDGAMVIGDMLNLNAEDAALVKQSMTFFGDLDFSGMTAFINEHGVNWKEDLRELLETELEKLNPIGKEVDGGIQVTAGTSITTARIQWTYDISFNDFKAQCATDQSLWVEQDFEITPAQMSYVGKIEVMIPAVTEKRLLPPSTSMMEAMFIERYGSPLDKARGHLLGSYDHAEVISYGKDNSVTGPTQRLYTDFGAIDASQTTGDTRNRDITWTGNFWDRLSAFTGEVNGVSYRDIPADMVKYLEGPMYLARQLSDFAKAMEFSYDNPSGDNAVQLGIYLDMLGVKDINHLYVKDGRYIDASTGKDLGAYEKDQPFGWSAMGKGWNDFMPTVLPSGQVVLMPKWGSTSDAGTIAMIVAVVATIFTAGAAGVALAGASTAAAAGTVGAVSIAGSVGTFLTGGLLTGTVAAGFGAAAIGLGVQLVAGQSMSIGDAVKTLAVGAVAGWAGGQFVEAVGFPAATAGSSLNFGQTVWNGMVYSAGSTAATNVINGNGVFDGMGRAIFAGGLSAGVGYGANAINQTAFKGFFNQGVVDAISTVVTGTVLGQDSTAILINAGGAFLRGNAGTANPNATAGGGSTALTSDQRAFLEANGLITVDVVNGTGGVIGTYTREADPGVQTTYINEEDGSPTQRISRYTAFDPQTGQRVLVTETYDVNNIQTNRTTAPITGVDPFNPTANILSVDTRANPTDPNSTVTRTFGVNGSAGSLTINPNTGEMVGDVQVNPNTRVSYSYNENNEQIEQTTITDPATGRQTVLVKNLTTQAVITPVTAGGETRYVPITDTSNVLSRTTLANGNIKLVFADNSEIEMNGNKIVSGTLHTVNGIETYEGTLVHMQLHTGGTRVLNTVDGSWVTTLSDRTITFIPEVGTVEVTANATIHKDLSGEIRSIVPTPKTGSTEGIMFNEQGRVTGGSGEYSVEQTLRDGTKVEIHYTVDDGAVTERWSNGQTIRTNAAGTEREIISGGTIRKEVDVTLADGTTRTNVTITQNAGNGMRIVQNGTLVMAEEDGVKTFVASGGVELQGARSYQEVHRFYTQNPQYLDANGSYTYNGRSYRAVNADQVYSAAQIEIAHQMTGIPKEQLTATTIQGALISYNNLTTPRNYSAETGGGRGNVNPGDLKAEVSGAMGIPINNVSSSNIVSYLVSNNYQGSIQAFTTGMSQSEIMRAVEAGSEIRLNREYSAYQSQFVRNEDLRMAAYGNSDTYTDPFGVPHNVIREEPLSLEAWKNKVFSDIASEQAIQNAMVDISGQAAANYNNLPQQYRNMTIGDYAAKLGISAEAAKVYTPQELAQPMVVRQDMVDAFARNMGMTSGLLPFSGISTAQIQGADRLTANDQNGTSGLASLYRDGSQIAALTLLTLPLGGMSVPARLEALFGRTGAELVFESLVGSTWAGITAPDVNWANGLAAAGTEFATNIAFGAAAAPVLGGLFRLGSSAWNVGSDLVRTFNPDFGAGVSDALRGYDGFGVRLPTSTVTQPVPFTITPNSMVIERFSTNASGERVSMGFSAGTPHPTLGPNAQGLNPYIFPNGQVQYISQSQELGELTLFSGRTSTPSNQFNVGSQIDVGGGQTATVVGNFGDQAIVQFSRDGSIGAVPIPGGASLIPITNGSTTNNLLTGNTDPVTGTGQTSVIDSGGATINQVNNSTPLRAEDVLPNSETYKAINMVDEGLPANVVNQFKSSVTSLANARTADEFSTFGNSIVDQVNGLRTAGVSAADVEYIKLAARAEFIENANRLFSPTDAQRIIGNLDTKLGYQAVNVPEAYRTWYQAVGQTGPSAISLEANFIRDLDLYRTNPNMMRAGDGNLYLVFQRSSNELPNGSMIDSTGGGTGSIDDAVGDVTVITTGNPAHTSNTDQFLNGQNNLTGDAAVAANNLRDSMRNLNDWNTNFSGNSNVTQSSKNIVANQVVDDVVGSTRGLLNDANLSPEQATALLTNVKNDLRAFVAANMDSVEGNRMLASLDDRLAGRDFSHHYSAGNTTTGSGTGGTGSTDLDGAQVSLTLTQSETYRSIHLATPDLPSAVVQNVADDLVRLSTVSNRAEFQLVGKRIVDQIDQLDRNLVSVSDVELLKTSVRMDYVKYAEKSFTPAEARSIISELDLQLGFTPQAPSRVVDSTRGYLGTTGGNVMTPERLAFENSLDSLQNWHNGLRNSISLNPIEKNLVAKDVIDEAIDSFKRFESSGNPNMSAADLERLRNRFVADLEDFIDDTMDAGSAGAAKTEMRALIDGQTGVVGTGSGTTGTNQIVDNHQVFDGLNGTAPAGSMHVDTQFDVKYENGRFMVDGQVVAEVPAADLARLNTASAADLHNPNSSVWTGFKEAYIDMAAGISQKFNDFTSWIGDFFSSATNAQRYLAKWQLNGVDATHAVNNITDAKSTFSQNGIATRDIDAATIQLVPNHSAGPNAHAFVEFANKADEAGYTVRVTSDTRVFDANGNADAYVDATNKIIFMKSSSLNAMSNPTDVAALLHEFRHVIETTKRESLLSKIAIRVNEAPDSITNQLGHYGRDSVMFLDEVPAWYTGGSMERTLSNGTNFDQLRRGSDLTSGIRTILENDIRFGDNFRYRASDGKVGFSFELPNGQGKYTMFIDVGTGLTDDAARAAARALLDQALPQVVRYDTAFTNQLKKYDPNFNSSTQTGTVDAHGGTNSNNSTNPVSDVHNGDILDLFPDNSVRPIILPNNTSGAVGSTNPTNPAVEVNEVDLDDWLRNGDGVDSGGAAGTRTPEQIFEDAFSKEWNDLKINPSTIANLQNLPGQQGAGFLRLETGEIGGQKVFIKTGSERLDTLRGGEYALMENEAHWYEVVDALGVGPKFHGVSEVTIGGARHPQLITEFVDGTHLQLNTLSGYSGPNTASIRGQILEIGKKLDDAGIRANDLQFRVTPEGRVIVIDPEDFKLSATSSGPSSTELAERYVELLENHASRTDGVGTGSLGNNIPEYTLLERNVAALTVGDNQITNLQPSGSAVIMTFADGTQGVWKPVRAVAGESYSAPGLAAYHVSELIGEHFVSVSTYRIHNGEMGVIQRFVSNDTDLLASRGLELADNPIRASFFDALIGNPDRHGSNYLVVDGRMVLIDNDAGFSSYATSRQQFRDALDREMRTYLEFDLGDLAGVGRAAALQRLQMLLPSRQVFNQLAFTPDDVWRSRLSGNLSAGEIDNFIANKNGLLEEIRGFEQEFGRSYMGNSTNHLIETRPLTDFAGSNRSPIIQVGDAAEIELSADELAQMFGNQGDRVMNMNANAALSASNPAAYYANFDLNVYFRGIENPFEHKTYFHGGPPESSGGFSASAEALRDAGQFLSRGDGASAVTYAEGAIKELQNIDRSFASIENLSADQLRPGFNNSGIQARQLFSNDRVIVEINPSTNSAGDVVTTVTIQSSDGAGRKHLLKLDLERGNVTINDAIAAFKQQATESRPLIARMMHDAQQVVEVGRLDNVISSTPRAMAENRIASEFVANQNYVGAGNIVNGNIPGQGQLAIGDASRGSQIRLSSQAADIHDLGDGFFVAGIDGQVAGITRQEIGVHFNDVVAARTANGLSPQLQGTKDVNFTQGYQGGEQIVYRTEVEGNAASIRGFLQGYVDSLAIGDRVAAGRIVAELPVLLNQTRDLNEGFIRLDRAALSTDGQALMEQSLRLDPSGEVLNTGFVRYSYHIRGEYGELIEMSAEIPMNASRVEALRMIKIQHESGLNAGLSVQRNLDVMQTEIQAVINHADVRGIDPIKVNYAEGFNPNAANTGDRVMNMNYQTLGDLKVPDQANDVIRRSAVVLWGTDLNPAEVAALFKSANRPQKALELLRAADFPESRIDQLFQRTGADDPYDPTKFQRLHMITDKEAREAVTLGSQPKLPNEGSQAIQITHQSYVGGFDRKDAGAIQHAVNQNRTAIAAEMNGKLPGAVPVNQIIAYVNSGLRIQDALGHFRELVKGMPDGSFKNFIDTIDSSVRHNMADTANEMGMYHALQLQRAKVQLLEEHYTRLYPKRGDIDDELFFNSDEAGHAAFDSERAVLQTLEGRIRPWWPK